MAWRAKQNSVMFFTPLKDSWFPVLQAHNGSDRAEVSRHTGGGS